MKYKSLLRMRRLSFVVYFPAFREFFVANINEFGRFDELKASVDRAKATDYFEKLDKVKISSFNINMRIHKLLQKFILTGGFDIEEPKE